MPEVLSGRINPVLSDFNSPRGTPLYVNRATGRGFVLSDQDAIVPLNGDGINVLDFDGIDPTGTTDSTGAIQAAIDSATNGGIIVIPSGVYLITTLILPSYIPILLMGAGVPQQGSGVASGTELRSLVRDFVTPAIQVSSATADFAQFSLENIYVSGGTYAEVIAGVGQGGAGVGNYVGLSLLNRHRWSLRNVRIAGFDTDGLRLEGTFYGAAYNCAFLFNGTGVEAVDSPNLDGFYNCHFQYNIYGSKNIRHTYSCAWEGQWKSGAVYNILNLNVGLHDSHFESNNASNTAGEADIWADSTNYLSSLHLDNVDANGGFAYSAKPVATYNFTGKCTRLILTGYVQMSHASPQNYPLMNLVGASAMYDYVAQPRAFANYVAFTAGQGSYYDLAEGYTDVVLASATLTHFQYRTVRLTAAGALNLDTIQAGGIGAYLTLLFGDANITVRSGIGNLLLNGHANIAATAHSTMSFVYDPNGGFWKEIGRSIY